MTGELSDDDEMDGVGGPNIDDEELDPDMDPRQRGSMARRTSGGGGGPRRHKPQGQPRATHQNDDDDF